MNYNNRLMATTIGTKRITTRFFSAGLLTVLAIFSAAAPAGAEEPHPLILEVYEGFQRGELNRWDAVMDANVIINSPAKFGTKGIEALKGWANEFLVAFAPRVDLVDYINAIDEDGNGRAVMTFNLNWKHIKPFYGVLQPTGRTGTSIENLIMTVQNGKVTRIEVADTTLDLAIYMHEGGWIFPQNVRPVPVVKGIERPNDQPAISLHN